MASFPSLVERLKGELECSVCLNVYTDPKTLPCLHTFCCHCLNELAERRVNREPIPCPDCRTEINLQEGSNFDAFPSSFYLNRLRDIVSVQRQGHQVLCSSCDKKSTATAFCFICECFICEECRDLHSRIKIMKGHRMTEFSEVQDTDVQKILRRPELCQEPYHANEILEYFCKPCQRCICRNCAIMTHKNHEFVRLDEAADQAKSRLEERKQKVQDQVGACKEQISKDQQTYRKMEEEILAAQRAIQHNIQRFIELAKRHEREMMTQLGTIHEDRERKFQDRKEYLELRLGQLNSVTDYLDSVLQRGISGEILQAERSVMNRAQELLNVPATFQLFNNERVKYKANDVYQRTEQSTFGRVLIGLADPDNTQIEGLGSSRIFTGQRVEFTVVTRDSEENVCYSAAEEVTVRILSPAGDDVETEVADEKDGNYSVCFTPNREGVHHVMVKVGGQCPANSPLDIHVLTRKPRDYKLLTTFGSHGSGKGQFQYPVDISVSSTGEIAVSDCYNHRVQIFSADGQYLREFGKQGTADGQFQYATGLAYNKAGNIIVGDHSNSRIQVFSPTGHWISKFGQDVSKRPWGVSVTSDDNVVVCNMTEKKVNMFSPEGRLLLQFVPSPGTQDQVSSVPHYAIFHGNKYFVSVDSQVVRVFDSHGSHLYDIGKGQLVKPRGLAVDTNDLLLVCDQGKDCVQVFTLEGGFVTSFGSHGSGKGQFYFLYGIEVTPDGRVFVCDSKNHCIQIFQPQY